MTLHALRLILYAASAAIFVIIIYSLIRQKSHLARYFFFSALCSFMYVFGYASELGARTLDQIRFWLTFEYFGLSFIGTFWFLLSWKLWFRHNPRFRMLLVLFFIPSVTLVLVTTQEYQGFFYKSLSLAESAGAYLVVIDRGPWYWVQTIFQLVIIILSLVLQLRTWHRYGGSRSNDSFWMLLGTLNLIPWIVVYQLGLSPYGIDLGPFGLAISTFFIAVAVFRFGALTSEEVLLHSIFASIEDAVVILDREGRVSDFNTSAQKIFPWLNASRVGKSVAEPEDIAIFADARGAPHSPKGSITKIVTIAGSKRIYQGKFTQIYDGRLALGRIYFFRDMTESHVLMRRLRRLASYDTLTSLYNRRRFMERAERLLARGRERGENISILMIDVDHFKSVNDRFGHAVGDRVLAAVGRVIQRRSLECGYAGRYGGEEFTVILEGLDREHAAELAEGIRQSIEGIAIEDRLIPIRVTVSIGVSTCDAQTGAYNIDTLLMSADRALYQAKSRGRNRVEC